MNHRLLPVLAACFLFACGQGPSDIPATPVTLSGPQGCVDSARRDTVVAVSQNLSIGFRVEDLLFINSKSDSVVYRRAQSIYADEARSLPRERIRKVAQTLAGIRPDIVGLQECLHLERDGRVVMDMLDTLRRDLDSMGLQGWTIHPRVMNPVDIVVHGPGGDSVRMVFHEGLAMIVSPRWKIEHDDLFPYSSVLSIDILGRRATSERAGQNLSLLRDDGFRLEAWNTHLEVLPFQRKNQATELVFAADSLRWIRRGEGPSGRLVMGDLNANPGEDADSLIRLSGWRDSWEEAHVRIQEPGYTCCVSDPRSPGAGYASTGNRIDYLLHQGGCAVDTSRVLLNQWFLTSAGDTLWSSDHGMVVSRIVYGVR